MNAHNILLRTQPKNIEEKRDEITENYNDIDKLYSILGRSLDDYFKQVKINAMSYLQAVSDLQQEIIEMRKDNIQSLLKLQKMTTEDLELSMNVRSPILDIMENVSSQNNKILDFQRQLLLTSIETLSKNVCAFNDNSSIFSNITQKILSSWASIIKDRNVEKDVMKY